MSKNCHLSSKSLCKIESINPSNLPFVTLSQYWLKGMYVYVRIDALLASRQRQTDIVFFLLDRFPRAILLLERFDEVFACLSYFLERHYLRGDALLAESLYGFRRYRYPYLIILSLHSFSAKITDWNHVPSSSYSLSPHHQINQIGLCRWSNEAIGSNRQTKSLGTECLGALL